MELEVLKSPSGQPVRYAGKLSGEKVLIPKSYVPGRMEMRGVWVATVDNIDFPSSPDAASFRRNCDTMLNNLKRANINTLFFQVRPTNDAFYPSRLNPPSRFMCGAEGRGFGNFDPLAYLVAGARRRGIGFHAWLNPYRVKKNAEPDKSGYLATLAQGNFARQNPAMVLDIVSGGKHQLILDPGEPKVIAFLVDTVREIINNYDVDGIHFDDYFYPYGGSGNADARSYNRYNNRRLGLEDWRRENVNTLVSEVSKAISSHNRSKGKMVQFGISPFGIWRNSKSDPSGSLSNGAESYSIQHADTRRWIRSGWIDYVVPQVYWTFDHNSAAYAAVTDWWVETVRGTRVNLYIGHIPSFYGNPAWRDAREIYNQLRYNCKHPEIKGSVMFSYKSLFNPGNPVMRKGAEVILSCWANPVPAPYCGPYRPAANPRPATTKQP